VSLVAAFEPIWILTAVGYGARRAGLLGDDAALVLGRYVFNLAMPAGLFLTLSRTPLSHFAGTALLAFAVSTIAVVGAGWVGSGLVFRRKGAERPIWGMAAGYVNSANLGIPIAQQVLGDVSFLAEVVLFQSLLITPIILGSLDRHSDAATGPRTGRAQLRRIGTIPLRNPPILGSLIGVLWSEEGWPVPAPVGGSLNLLAASVVPAALIALGASLHSNGEAPAGRVEIAVITALKLIVQPLIALGVGALLGLPDTLLLAVVLSAGLPTAQNTFIFAQEHRAGEELANRAVVVTTILSLITLAVTAALLGHH
jgi:malonate transporter and related proteins